MDEVLRNLSQIVVNDVRNVVDVYTARGHVGSYQHLKLAIFESTKGARTLGLRTITVNHRRSKSVTHQVLG